MEVGGVTKPKIQRKQRRSFVCLACKSKKIKCDKGRPRCKRCTETNKLCIYETDHVWEKNVSDNISPATADITSVSYNISPVTPTVRLPPYGTLPQPRETRSDSNMSITNLIQMTEPKNFNNRPETIPTPGATSNRSNETEMNSEPYSGKFSNTDNKDILLSNNLTTKPRRINKLPSISMDLWNPRDILVSYGSTTYYDLPYNTHSAVQSDPYLRALCAGLHGDTMTELRAKLTTISSNTPGIRNKYSYQNNTPDSDTSTLLENNYKSLELQSDPNERELHPLRFIEKAIVKWIENTNQLVTNQLPLDYFNTTYTIDDVMDLNLLSSLQTLIREIEVIMVDKVLTDLLLRKFYEEIYPFFPLFDIHTFETNLIYVLMPTSGKRYEINVYTSNIRKKLETLVLLLLILSITLRSTSFDEEQFGIDKDNALNTARQLLIFAQKLLSLLNGFKFTNENIICCLLYQFIAEFLNPENRDVDVTHDKVLTLKCIESLSLTVGLFNDPSLYPRFGQDPLKNDAFNMFRRKLWIALQSMKLQMMTVNGGSSELDIKYLQEFIGDTPDVISSWSSKFDASSDIDKKIFSLQEDKYHFHIILAKLMVCSTAIGQKQDLQEILDNITAVTDYMQQRFPISRLQNSNNFKNVILEPTWRGARVDIGSVEAIEIFNANILGLSSIMHVYNKLIPYFEKQSINSSEKYEIYYHKFFLESMNVHLQLTNLIVDYLKGNFAHTIMKNHQYCINKFVFFTLVRIWLAQMSYGIRFSYKKEILRQQEIAKSNAYLNEHHEEDEKLKMLLKINLSHIKQQVEATVDLAAKELQDPYFGCYQAILMIRYLLYVMDNAGLAKVINRFWERAFNSSDISEYVLLKINMKWGLSTKGSNFVSKYLMNPESLRNLNLPLLNQIQYMFNEATFYTHPTEETIKLDDSPPGFDNEEMLNQFLESNFDLFLGVINDKLGELPTL